MAEPILDFLARKFLGMSFWLWFLILFVLAFLTWLWQRKRTTKGTHSTEAKDALIRQLQDFISRKTALKDTIIRLTIERIELIKGHDKVLEYVDALDTIIIDDPANIWTDSSREKVRLAGGNLLRFLEKEREFVVSLSELHKLEAQIKNSINQLKAAFKSLRIDADSILDEINVLITHQPVKKTDAGIIWLVRMCYDYTKRETAYALSLEDAIKESKIEDLISDRLKSVKGKAESLKVNIGAENPLVRLMLKQKLELQIRKLNELLEKLSIHTTPTSNKPSPTIHPDWPDNDGKHNPTPPEDSILPIEPKIKPQPKPEPTKYKKTFVDLSPWFMPIKNQNKAGACGAFAGASIVEFLMNTDSMQSIVNKKPEIIDAENELSELFLWWFIRTPADRQKNIGVYGIREIPKSLEEYGDCFENFWQWLPLDSSQVPTKFATEPSKDSMQDALDKTIPGHKALFPSDPDSWVRELLDGNPVLLGIMVDTEFDNCGKTKDLLTKKGKDRGGHAVVLVGFTTDYPNPEKPNETIPAFKIRNSWGKDWGENGYLWISYDLLPQILIDEPFVFKRGFQQKKEENKEKKEEQKKDGKTKLAHVLRLTPINSSPKGELKIISFYHDTKLISEEKDPSFRFGKQNNSKERQQHVVLLNTEIQDEIQAKIYFYSDEKGNGKFKITNGSPQSPTVIKFNDQQVNWEQLGDGGSEFEGFITKDVTRISINEYDFKVNLSKEEVQDITEKKYNGSFLLSILKLDAKKEDSQKYETSVLTLVPKNSSPKDKIKILSKFHTIHTNNAAEGGMNDSLTIGKIANYKAQFIALKDTKNDDEIQSRIAFFPRENKFRAFSIGDTKIKINGEPRISDINQINSNAWVDENTRTISINEYEFDVRLSMERDQQINSNDYAKTFDNTILSLDKEDQSTKVYDPVTKEKIERQVETFSTSDIETSIRKLLDRIDAVKSIDALEVVGYGNEMILKAKITASKWFITTQVTIEDVHIINQGNYVGLREGYNIYATVAEGRVKSLFDKHVNSIGTKLKDYIEQNSASGKKVDKIWIEEGKLNALFK